MATEIIRKLSLSARRAWIEMMFWLFRSCRNLVALRKESVDRNLLDISLDYKEVLSLSARRAWIEMRKITITVDDVTVALRKESVDRN